MVTTMSGTCLPILFIIWNFLNNIMLSFDSRKLILSLLHIEFSYSPKLKSLQFVKQQHECWYLSLTSCKIWTYVRKELITNKLYLNWNIILETKSVIDTNDNCQIMRPLKAVRMSVNPFDSAPGPIKVNPSNKHMVQRALDGWSQRLTRCSGSQCA